MPDVVIDLKGLQCLLVTVINIYYCCYCYNINNTSEQVYKSEARNSKVRLLFDYVMSNDTHLEIN